MATATAPVSGIRVFFSNPIWAFLGLLVAAFLIAVVAGFGWRLATGGSIHHSGMTTVPVQLPPSSATSWTSPPLPPVEAAPATPVADPIPGNCTMTLNGVLYHNFGPVGPDFTPRECAEAKAKKAADDGLIVSGR